jgi:DNA-directed RNA polymerase subunit M/transcription elongation factor TFIIS
VKVNIRTVIICPRCGEPFYVESSKRATYVNCPKCNKAIPVRGKKKEVKIVCCPKCKTFQATRSTTRFKCRMCGHSEKIEKLKVYYKVENGRDAIQIIQKLNEARKKG